MSSKNQIRLEAFNFFQSLDPKIRTKFNNVCGKTGKYDVPDELFQKRTSRKNRVLLPWKSLKSNGLTIEQLNSFAGGVAVEFVNEDFFLPENQSDPVFQELKNRIGGDETVSAIISIRSESGSSSSQVPRDNFSRLINNTTISYKGKQVTITKDNFMEYRLKRNGKGGMGNDSWSGFLFVSIRGGQQDTIQTHKGEELAIFNPACEYASKEVCIDIDLVMSYYALVSIDKDTLSDPELNIDSKQYKDLLNKVREALKGSNYDHAAYKGSLLDHCDNHPSVKMIKGQLTDPIQVEQIKIMDLAVDDKEDLRNLDLTHDEAVNLGKFYWDKEKKTILSPARPTNIFWSRHLSNMMQQNYDLSAYFEHERERSERRARLLKLST